MALVEVEGTGHRRLQDGRRSSSCWSARRHRQGRQSLLTVESDKASMEIPSSAAGVVKELKVALGDKINEGTVIAALRWRRVPPAPAPAPAAVRARRHRRRAGAAPARRAGPGGRRAAASAAGSVGVRYPTPSATSPTSASRRSCGQGAAASREGRAGLLSAVKSDKASMEIPSSHPAARSQGARRCKASAIAVSRAR